MSLTRRKAIELLDRAIKIAQSKHCDEFVYVNIAEACLKLREFEKAVDIYQMVTMPDVKKQISLVIVEELINHKMVTRALTFIESLEDEDKPGLLALLVEKYFSEKESN